MIIVSDASPITNLLQIGCLSILKAVYNKIILPKTVYDELCEMIDQKEIIDQQEWISIAAATNRAVVSQLENNLDKGEAEAIALALELQSDFLIIDERRGRDIAESMGIKIVGLLGTLLKAKQLGLIPEIKPKLEQLKAIGFRMNPRLFEHFLILAGEE